MAQAQQSTWQPPSYAIPVGQGNWKPPSYAVPAEQGGTYQDFVSSPQFQSMSLGEKSNALNARDQNGGYVYPEYGNLSPQEKAQRLDELHYTPKLGLNPNATPPTNEPPSSDAATYAKKLLQGAGNILGGVGASVFKPISTLYGAAETPLENLGAPPASVKTGEAYLGKLASPPPTMGGAVGNLAGQAAQYILPAGLEEKAATSIGEALPEVPGVFRGLAKMTPAALSSGTISSLQGTGFVPGAVLGAAAEPINELAQGIGGRMAARAAGVTDKQLQYGAKPGEEILNLPGIRPSTLRRSAAEKATELTQKLENEVAKSGKPVSLGPAKKAVNDAISKAANREDITTFNHLAPLTEQVSHLPDSASASQALEYKRGLGTLAKFYGGSPITDPAKSAAREAYGAVDKALDQAVPKANDLDDRIHSLLTVAKPRGSGGMGLGKYILPYIAARAIESGGGGPLGELAGMGLTFAGESPTGRILIGKGIAKAPRLERIARPALLEILRGASEKAQ